MALKATIFKANLNVSDMDRNYYQEHILTLARHPSETDERMMVRLLAFARHADTALEFGRGLSAVDEPDLWRKNLTGDIELWIELGQPDEKRIRKACGRAGRVIIYTYSGHSADLWWRQLGATLRNLHNLTVYNLPAVAGEALTTLAQRSMQLQCTIQDGELWMSDGSCTLQVEVAVRD